MPRFYCPTPLQTAATVALPEAAAHHLHVLRIPVGATITLFNGEGGEYAARLTEIGRKRATVTIDSFSPREAELPYRVTLAQALPEAAKMDWIIEKSVELGAAAIQPLAARRCVVRLNAERAAKKGAHWQGIIIAACEQSGRNRLAQLRPLADYDDWIRRPASEPRLLLTPRAPLSLAHWAQQQQARDLSLLVGPEGGLSPEEEQAAISAGAVPLGMGPRVLRTETAGLAALAILNAAWGQM